MGQRYFSGSLWKKGDLISAKPASTPSETSKALNEKAPQMQGFFNLERRRESNPRHELGKLR